MIKIWERLSQMWRACAHGRRAQAAVERGDLADAIREGEAVLRSSPEDPSAQFFAAQVYVAAGLPAKALELLHEVARCWPDDAPTWYAIGACCDYLDDYRSAMAAYQRTLEIAPHWVIAGKHAGRCAWYLGDRRAALHLLQRYCAEAPDDQEAHDLLGYLDYEDGRVRQSFSHYAAASRLAPLNPKFDRNARVMYQRSALS